MSTFDYNVENHNIWFGPKESAFRTTAYGKDTFDAAMTVYPMPMQLTRTPRIYLKRKKVVEHIPGYVDPGYAAHHGFGKGEMVLNGPMYDLSMMYFLWTACTTADDTPSGGLYTHTYATTTARAARPPTFPMVYKLVNDAAANAQDEWVLYTGCTFKKAVITGNPNERLDLQITIEFAKETVGGTALSSEPYTTLTRAFDFDDAVITFTKATVAVPGVCDWWQIIIDNGSMLDKAGGETYAERASNGPRKVQLKMKWRFFSKPTELVNEDAPADADDLDCTIKISRNTTSDYEQFAFEKLWNEAAEDGSWDWNDYKMNQMLNLTIKPTARETGAKLTHTAVNALTDARYEGT